MKTMKRFASRLCAVLLVLTVSVTALVPAAFAAKAQLPSLPSDQCVVDDANVLSDSTTTTIENLNAQLTEQCSGAQIGVLTVEYTGSVSTEDYAVQAANAWGLGSSSNNNGVLILLVMQSQQYADGDYYLATGDGFRNTTLEKQASAIAQTMEDSFAAGDYDAAVTTCAQNVASTIADIYGVTLSGTTGSTGTVGNGNTGSYNDSYYDAPAASYQSPFVTLLSVLVILFALKVIFSGIRHGMGGGGFGPFFGFGLGYGLGSRRRRRPPYDDWGPGGPRGPRGPRPPRGASSPWGRRLRRRFLWRRHGRRTLRRQFWRRELPRRRRLVPWRRRWPRQISKKMAVQPGCTAIFCSVEITWCRRYGRLRHPGRARCNRSRSGGRPWHPDRYRHRGVPCAGPQCLPEQRSGR